MRIGKYKVYRCGTIRNTETGYRIKPQDNGKGYKKVTLSINKKPIQKYVHRLVAEAYCKNGNNKTQVNHIDGDKSNNDYSNLEWVSNSENQIHAHKTGLKQNGNKLWNGKFSKEDIELIKWYDGEGMKGVDIAKLFECSKSTISEILNGKRYKTYTTH